MMRDAKQILDQQFIEMRWRCLSLAADMDRLARAPGGSDVMLNDHRLHLIRRALHIVEVSAEARAEKVQMLFSDLTPPPSK